MVADLHWNFKEYKIGDFVMVCTRPEQFPQGVMKKLQARNAGPSQILKRIGSNAYLLDLTQHMGICPIFNVEDLVPFRGPTTTN